MPRIGMTYKKAGWYLHMMPAGYLMLEHRLIESMVDVIPQMLKPIKDKRKLNTSSIDIIIDFLRTYADKSHHGKEEDILFLTLAKKKLIPKHKKIMSELIAEHKKGRAVVAKLANAKERYIQKDPQVLKDAVKYLKWLVDFYRRHIDKEDRRFFIDCMRYLNDNEQKKMLLAFYSCDKNGIHNKYRKIVHKFEKKVSKGKR